MFTRESLPTSECSLIDWIPIPPTFGCAHKGVLCLRHSIALGSFYRHVNRIYSHSTRHEIITLNTNSTTSNQNLKEDTKQAIQCKSQTRVITTYVYNHTLLIPGPLSSVSCPPCVSLGLSLVISCSAHSSA